MLGVVTPARVVIFTFARDYPYVLSNLTDHSRILGIETELLLTTEANAGSLQFQYF